MTSLLEHVLTLPETGDEHSQQRNETAQFITSAFNAAMRAEEENKEEIENALRPLLANSPNNVGLPPSSDNNKENHHSADGATFSRNKGTTLDASESQCVDHKSDPVIDITEAISGFHADIAAATATNAEEPKLGPYDLPPAPRIVFRDPNAQLVVDNESSAAATVSSSTTAARPPPHSTSMLRELYDLHKDTIFTSRGITVLDARPTAAAACNQMSGTASKNKNDNNNKGDAFEPNRRGSAVSFPATATGGEQHSGGVLSGGGGNDDSGLGRSSPAAAAGDATDGRWWKGGSDASSYRPARTPVFLGVDDDDTPKGVDSTRKRRLGATFSDRNGFGEAPASVPVAEWSVRSRRRQHSEAPTDGLSAVTSSFANSRSDEDEDGTRRADSGNGNKADSSLEERNTKTSENGNAASQWRGGVEARQRKASNAVSAATASSSASHHAASGESNNNNNNKHHEDKNRHCDDDDGVDFRVKMDELQRRWDEQIDVHRHLNAALVQIDHIYRSKKAQQQAQETVNIAAKIASRMREQQAWVERAGMRQYRNAYMDALDDWTALRGKDSAAAAVEGGNGGGASSNDKGTNVNPSSRGGSAAAAGGGHAHKVGPSHVASQAATKAANTTATTTSGGSLKVNAGTSPAKEVKFSSGTKVTDGAHPSSKKNSSSSGTGTVTTNDGASSALKQQSNKAKLSLLPAPSISAPSGPYKKVVRSYRPSDSLANSPPQGGGMGGRATVAPLSASSILKRGSFSTPTRPSSQLEMGDGRHSNSPSAVRGRQMLLGSLFEGSPIATNTNYSSNFDEFEESAGAGGSKSANNFRKSSAVYSSFASQISDDVYEGSPLRGGSLTRLHRRNSATRMGGKPSTSGGKGADKNKRRGRKHLSASIVTEDEDIVRHASDDESYIASSYGGVSGGGGATRKKGAPRRGAFSSSSADSRRRYESNDSTRSSSSFSHSSSSSSVRSYSGSSAAGRRRMNKKHRKRHQKRREKEKARRGGEGRRHRSASSDNSVEDKRRKANVSITYVSRHPANKKTPKHRYSDGEDDGIYSSEAYTSTALESSAGFSSSLNESAGRRQASKKKSGQTKGKSKRGGGGAPHKKDNKKKSGKRSPSVQTTSIIDEDSDIRYEHSSGSNSRRRSFSSSSSSSAYSRSSSVSSSAFVSSHYLSTDVSRSSSREAHKNRRGGKDGGGGNAKGRNEITVVPSSNPLTLNDALAAIENICVNLIIQQQQFAASVPNSQRGAAPPPHRLLLEGSSVGEVGSSKKDSTAMSAEEIRTMLHSGAAASGARDDEAANGDDDDDAISKATGASSSNQSTTTTNSSNNKDDSNASSASSATAAVHNDDVVNADNQFIVSTPRGAPNANGRNRHHRGPSVAASAASASAAVSPPTSRPDLRQAPPPEALRAVFPPPQPTTALQNGGAIALSSLPPLPPPPPPPLQSEAARDVEALRAFVTRLRGSIENIAAEAAKRQERAMLLDQVLTLANVRETMRRELVAMATGTVTSTGVSAVPSSSIGGKVRNGKNNKKNKNNTKGGYSSSGSDFDDDGNDKTHPNPIKAILRDHPLARQNKAIFALLKQVQRTPAMWADVPNANEKMLATLRESLLAAGETRDDGDEGNEKKKSNTNKNRGGGGLSNRQRRVKDDDSIVFEDDDGSIVDEDDYFGGSGGGGRKKNNRGRGGNNDNDDDIDFEDEIYSSGGDDYSDDNDDGIDDEIGFEGSSNSGGSDGIDDEIDDDFASDFSNEYGTESLAADDDSSQIVDEATSRKMNIIAKSLSKNIAAKKNHKKNGGMIDTSTGTAIAEEIDIEDEDDAEAIADISDYNRGGGNAADNDSSFLVQMEGDIVDDDDISMEAGSSSMGYDGGKGGRMGLLNPDRANTAGYKESALKEKADRILLAAATRISQQIKDEEADFIEDEDEGVPFGTKRKKSKKQKKSNGGKKNRNGADDGKKSAVAIAAKRREHIEDLLSALRRQQQKREEALRFAVGAEYDRQLKALIDHNESTVLRRKRKGGGREKRDDDVKRDNKKTVSLRRTPSTSSAAAGAAHSSAASIATSRASSFYARGGSQSSTPRSSSSLSSSRSNVISYAKTSSSRRSSSAASPSHIYSSQRSRSRSTSASVIRSSSVHSAYSSSAAASFASSSSSYSGASSDSTFTRAKRSRAKELTALYVRGENSPSNMTMAERVRQRKGGKTQRGNSPPSSSDSVNDIEAAVALEKEAESNFESHRRMVEAKYLAARQQNEESKRHQKKKKKSAGQGTPASSSEASDGGTRQNGNFVKTGIINYRQLELERQRASSAAIPAATYPYPRSPTKRRRYTNNNNGNKSKYGNNMNDLIKVRNDPRYAWTDSSHSSQEASADPDSTTTTTAADDSGAWQSQFRDDHLNLRREEQQNANKIPSPPSGDVIDDEVIDEDNITENYEGGRTENNKPSSSSSSSSSASSSPSSSNTARKNENATPHRRPTAAAASRGGHAQHSPHTPSPSSAAADNRLGNGGVTPLDIAKRAFIAGVPTTGKPPPHSPSSVSSPSPHKRQHNRLLPPPSPARHSPAKGGGEKGSYYVPSAFVRDVRGLDTADQLRAEQRQFDAAAANHNYHAFAGDSGRGQSATGETNLRKRRSEGVGSGVSSSDRRLNHSNNTIGGNNAASSEDDPFSILNRHLAESRSKLLQTRADALDNEEARLMQKLREQDYTMRTRQYEYEYDSADEDENGDDDDEKKKDKNDDAHRWRRDREALEKEQRLPATLKSERERVLGQLFATATAKQRALLDQLYGGYPSSLLSQQKTSSSPSLPASAATTTHSRPRANVIGSSNTTATVKGIATGVASDSNFKQSNELMLRSGGGANGNIRKAERLLFDRANDSSDNDEDDDDSSSFSSSSGENDSSSSHNSDGSRHNESDDDSDENDRSMGRSITTSFGVTITQPATTTTSAKSPSKHKKSNNSNSPPLPLARLATAAATSASEETAPQTGDEKQHRPPPTSSTAVAADVGAVIVPKRLAFDDVYEIPSEAYGEGNLADPTAAREWVEAELLNMDAWKEAMRKGIRQYAAHHTAAAVDSGVVTDNGGGASRGTSEPPVAAGHNEIGAARNGLHPRLSDDSAPPPPPSEANDVVSAENHGNSPSSLYRQPQQHHFSTLEYMIRSRFGDQQGAREAQLQQKAVEDAKRRLVERHERRKARDMRRQQQRMDGETTSSSSSSGSSSDASPFAADARLSIPTPPPVAHASGNIDILRHVGASFSTIGNIGGGDVHILPPPPPVETSDVSAVSASALAAQYIASVKAQREAKEAAKAQAEAEALAAERDERRVRVIAELEAKLLGANGTGAGRAANVTDRGSASVAPLASSSSHPQTQRESIARGDYHESIASSSSLPRPSTASSSTVSVKKSATASTAGPNHHGGSSSVPLILRRPSNTDANTVKQRTEALDYKSWVALMQREEAAREAKEAAEREAQR